jgi:hypothetical protein
MGTMPPPRQVATSAPLDQGNNISPKARKKRVIKKYNYFIDGLQPKLLMRSLNIYFFQN